MLQTTVIAPLQNIINRSFNSLAEANSLPQEFRLEEYRMYKIDVSARANEITSNINSLSPLVANKVLESMSADEIRALVGLKPAIVEAIPTDAPNVESEKMAEPSLDDVSKSKLKGTVGGINGILQIKQAVVEGIMDYSSACAMLQIMFGYSEEECQAILGQNPNPIF
jgi:hypothetical protein